MVSNGDGKKKEEGVQITPLVLTLWGVFIVGCAAAGYAQTETLAGLMGGLSVGCLIPFVIYAMAWFER